VEVIFYPLLPDFRESIVFWNVSRLSLFIVLEEQHVYEDEYGEVGE
jgi:hypothetical protein